MNHKVFRSIFILAVAIGIFSVVARTKHTATPSPTQKPADPLARPLASYRVYEDPSDGGIDYRGANYKGRVSPQECSFGAVPEAGAIQASREFTVSFGAPRIEQGSVRVQCIRERFNRPGFGVAQLDCGSVTE